MKRSTTLRHIARRRSTKRASSPRSAAEQVARINEISATCKSTWFGLLSYLAFVGVTWMGVEDVDFFLPGRDTALPLIGVSVPTLLFFGIGPSIGALIYAYFHMQLLKLWEALADAPASIDGAPLSDHIKPWLVIDLCLSYRTDGALRKRALAKVSNIINFLFAFWGTPVVLIALWWSSTPPHTDWLTLIACGVPLIFTLFVGLSSWQSMRNLMMDSADPKFGISNRQKGILLLFAFGITTLGWLKVEGTFRNYALAVFDAEQVSDSLVDWEIIAFLTPADLSEVNFANTPPDWQDRATFRQQHRSTWCGATGLPANVCGPAPDLDDPTWAPPLGLSFARQNWCETLGIEDASDNNCVTVFADYEADFETAWLRRRDLDLRSLPSFDLSRADLRQANLGGAQLQGAVLWGAQLQGAYLWRAQLQRATLWRAQLQGANLTGVQLQGADLWDAQLQGAVLGGAQLQGADLEGAQLQGAYLGGARFDAQTSLIAATLRGAAVRNVDFTTVPQIAEHLEDIFGDASVTLPEGVEAPGHWPQSQLDFSEFRTQWRAWQATLPPGWDQPKP